MNGAHLGSPVAMKERKAVGKVRENIMNATKKLAAVATLALSTLACTSVFAAPQPEWRNGNGNRGVYTRDSRHEEFVRGVVQSVNRRNSTVEIRDRNRTITVWMQRRNARGTDISDLRRGDYVTFAGDWSRGRVFQAWRIDSVDSARGRGRR